MVCQKKKRRKTKKKLSLIKPEDKWYKGWKKYQEGAGKKLMDETVKKYEIWQLQNPDATAGEVSEFLKKLCLVKC